MFVSLRDTLAKFGEYNHLKNWIMGTIITVLASTTAFLLGLWIRGRL